MTRNAAVLERGRAVELRATPRRVAAATTPPPPSRTSGPRGRGVKISKFAIAPGGAGESMHRYSNRRNPLIHLALLATTADRRTP